MPILNDAGKSLIKSFEKCSLIAYNDGYGVWTQGWGHTHGITPSSTPIMQDEADQWFDSDIAIFEPMVNTIITIPLNDNQYSALVSLCFNAGSAPLHQTLGTKLNAGDYTGAADQFLRWVYAGGRLSDGLVNRRLKEKALFLTPC